MKKTLSLLLVLAMLIPASVTLASDNLTCWFPPGWKDRAIQAKAITDALSAKSGLAIRPRIAKSYPEILSAFSGQDANLVYVGSFVQAIVAARQLGTPLVQNADGKELYSGILIYPQGQDPQAILKNSPADIAYATGATSGESSAQAATAGKAAIGTPNHGAAVNAVKAGKAKAAVVKNFWWDGNQDKFPGMLSYAIPGISEQRNPDNVLTASKAVSKEVADKVKAAALASSDAFGANAKMVEFSGDNLAFSLDLMKRGNIDPLTYSW
ncbi:MAG: PhnD/SsuA/transferrin family substrate-binding protein [Desulfuromonadales bacterium]|nr:PhnD/SsuA/transferrin family substrate-binding protein [Desulfuromonadales bacterium]